MNYLSQLTESEMQYICSVIPLKDSICYFKMYPKEFAKIMPGFRAKSMKDQAKVSALLFRYHDNNFISSFIEKHIKNWLSQIQEHVAKMEENGDSRELAFLHTLPFSFFSNNVGLYFKLINEKYPEEYISLLNASVTTTKKTFEQQDKLKKELEIKKSEIRNLQLDLNKVKSDLEKIKLNERKMETKKLKRNLANLEKLKSTMQSDKKTIAILESQIKVQEETVNSFRKELDKIKKDNQQLEAKIRSELKEQHDLKIFEQQTILKAKCPRNMVEFKEFLGYNLENISIPINSEYYSLLIKYLSKILFQGLPIVINRCVGKTFIRCIANTLIGQTTVKTLIFDNDISTDNIHNFLTSSDRVVCLDNFIGNYNETKLLPLFDSHRNKIIFLTVAYDRTMYYISKEFLRYCKYLNLNRIAVLSTNVELTEDPSTFEEIDSEFHGAPQENRYASLLRGILGELGFPRGLIEQKCIAISDEQDLCCILAFDVLPYCVDVLQIAPYHTSEKLIRYAGNTGNCPYKNLLKRWFEQ
ncbi:MAG: hypothetical protein PWQ77_821 [Kosmotogales bacterium]|nr:hypothetical protein [Kosmotogales bacterium]